ncbi:MAG: LytTR family transcriptional regulator [Clostridia bacterium]|nr:LytTR family transcriptional regulator [Clostridia bacterium]
MDIKINTNISSEFNEASITINAPELTDEIQNIIKYVSNVNENKDQIIANKNNEIYFINLNDIMCFFSKDKYNYLRTEKGIYKIKYKLYEIEDVYKDRDFIRISNSCIININQVECFDTSILGTILVKLKDNTQEAVSKRNVSRIMKILKERGNIK